MEENFSLPTINKNLRDINKSLVRIGVKLDDAVTVIRALISRLPDPPGKPSTALPSSSICASSLGEEKITKPEIVVVDSEFENNHIIDSVASLGEEHIKISEVGLTSETIVAAHESEVETPIDYTEFVSETEVVPGMGKYECSKKFDGLYGYLGEEQVTKSEIISFGSGSEDELATQESDEIYKMPKMVLGEFQMLTSEGEFYDAHKVFDEMPMSKSVHYVQVCSEPFGLQFHVPSKHYLGMLIWPTGVGTSLIVENENLFAGRSFIPNPYYDMVGFGLVASVVVPREQLCTISKIFSNFVAAQRTVEEVFDSDNYGVSSRIKEGIGTIYIYENLRLLNMDDCVGVSQELFKEYGMVNVILSYSDELPKNRLVFENLSDKDAEMFEAAGFIVLSLLQLPAVKYGLDHSRLTEYGSKSQPHISILKSMTWTGRNFGALEPEEIMDYLLHSLSTYGILGSLQNLIWVAFMEVHTVLLVVPKFGFVIWKERFDWFQVSWIRSITTELGSFAEMGKLVLDHDIDHIDLFLLGYGQRDMFQITHFLMRALFNTSFGLISKYFLREFWVHIVSWRHTGFVFTILTIYLQHYLGEGAVELLIIKLYTLLVVTFMAMGSGEIKGKCMTLLYVTVKEASLKKLPNSITYADDSYDEEGDSKVLGKSYFLISMKDDSINGLYETLQDGTVISKSARGIVVSVGSHIRGTIKTSKGIVLMLRVSCNDAGYVAQGVDKKKGVFVVYLESWDDEFRVGQDVFLDDGNSSRLGMEAISLSGYAQMCGGGEECDSNSEQRNSTIYEAVNLEGIIVLVPNSAAGSVIKKAGCDVDPRTRMTLMVSNSSCDIIIGKRGSTIKLFAEGSQSSYVFASHQILHDVSVIDCLATQVTKKRGTEKQIVHRKSLDAFGQRISQYKSVTRHIWIGRYEAYLWKYSCTKEGQRRKRIQAYLKGYDMEEKAARAYDLVALQYWAPSTHIKFSWENYELEREEMKNRVVYGTQYYVVDVSTIIALLLEVQYVLKQEDRGTLCRGRNGKPDIILVIHEVLFYTEVFFVFHRPNQILEDKNRLKERAMLRVIIAYWVINTGLYICWALYTIVGFCVASPSLI